MSNQYIKSWNDIKCPYCHENNKRSPEDMPWVDEEIIEVDCLNSQLSL